MKLKNYIGGQWVEPENGQYESDIDPANGEVVAEVPRSSVKDAERAIAAAAEAYKEWRKVPAPKRGEILFTVGQILKERKHELAQKMTREMGKVYTEAAGDVQEGIDMAFYMAGEGRRSFGKCFPWPYPPSGETPYAYTRVSPGFSPATPVTASGNPRLTALCVHVYGSTQMNGLSAGR